MTDNSKLIADWQEKVKKSFGDEARLYDYLFETLENFFYRYLETSESRQLKVQELAPSIYGAQSFEGNLVEALKLKNPQAKPGMIEMAKSIPRSQTPKVRYELSVEVKELTSERGFLSIRAIIDWDFPNYSDPEKRAEKRIDFRYQELAQFRKELALKLEDVCEFFS
jgi:hypothetical protein